MNFDDFKITTRIRKVNLWLQILLGLMLYVSLNYMASRHYVRIDFSENNKNSLSPESIAYIKNLKHNIDVFVVLSATKTNNENTSVKKDLSAFLNQYEYESVAPNKIKVEFVNSNIDNRKTELLVKKFGSNIENSVIVSSPMRSKIIPISDFYTILSEEAKNFNGETLMTSAILNVSEEKQPKIYLLRGHGELDANNTSATKGMSEFALALLARNYLLQECRLDEGKPLPDDADMLIIAAPKANFLPVEIAQIRKYLLKDNGRVVLFLAMGNLCGLEDVLFDWGIRSDDMQVLDTAGYFESSEGDLIARTFPKNSHPIVKYLVNADMPAQFGSVRPVRKDEGAPPDDTLKLDVLLLSSNSSWAEKSYQSGIKNQVYNSSIDLLGPIPLAMVASRTGGKAYGLNIPGGKLAVFGDENFVVNKWFGRMGNSMLAINTINWLFDEGKTLKIPPRVMKIYSITISNDELLGLALRFFILPLGILLFGMIVSIIRRN